MKKRKLKAFVLPSLYLMIIGAIFIGIGFMNERLNTKPETPTRTVSTIIEESEPVMSNTSDKVMPTEPYNSENVTIIRDYYSKDDEEQVQQKSLIQYENTYLENTGILYGANDAFSVLAVLDGTVTNIKDDEFLGKVIEIKHSNNLSTFYYSLDDIKVNVNDQVKAGDEIATSGTNKINNEGTSLLFEVYYKGKTMDPEEFYKTDANTLNKD